MHLSAPEPVAGDAGTPTNDLLDRLRQFIPEAFADGTLDLSALAEELSSVNAETAEERYRFSWHGRTAAVASALAPTRAALAPASGSRGHVPDAGNVFVEGDNLEVLKVLRRSYSGRFKLIYIDPPYNTGNDFVYRDDTRDPLSAYLQATGQTDEAGSVLVANPEGQGRYHSRWLSMMYPRLRVARELLRADGVFIAAIGDEEVHHLRLLLDDIFGPENRVGTMVWEGGRKNDAKLISVGHDYMLVYARDLAQLKESDGNWRVAKPGVDGILAKVEELQASHGADHDAATRELRAFLAPLRQDVRKLSAACELVAGTYPEIASFFPELTRPLTELPGQRYNQVDARGAYRLSDLSWPGGGGHDYDIVHPDVKEPVRKPTRGWLYAENDMKRLIKEERIDFKADETGVPEYKRYLHETEREVLTSVFYRTRTRAAQELEVLMGANVFDFPKDPDVLATLIEATTKGDDLVLDFFAGSGSTADAVLRQNRKDGQRRRFVMVTLPEPLNDKTETGKNALTSGFAHIAELSMERVRRSGAKLAGEEGGHDGEDLDFRAYRLSEPLHAPFAVVGDGVEDEAVAMEQMSFAVASVPADADPERLLVEVLLREGFSLTAPVEELEGLPNKLYRVTDRRPSSSSDQVLLVCLDGAVAPGLVEHVPALAATSGAGLASSVVLVCRDDAVTDSTLANLGLVCGECGWQLKTL